MTLAIDYWFPIALDCWFPNFSLYVVIVLINTTLWFKYVSYISDKELTIQIMAPPYFIVWLPYLVSPTLRDSIALT